MDNVLLSIACLLALLIALLAIPLSISFSFTRHRSVQASAHFHWLFGLVNFQAHFPDETSSIKREKTTQKENTKPHKEMNNARDIIALFKQSTFRQHIIKFIKNLLRASHAQDLYLLLRIGLGDPADTGILWAVIGPLSGMMKNLQSAKIEIEPEFIDSVLEIESRGHFHLVPLQFIALTIGFIFSPTTIRAWYVMHRGN